MSERDKVLGHADEADGIEEYDNPLPTWWLGLFVGTVMFGIGYAVDYHFVSHRSQAAEYAAELAAAPKPPEATAVAATPDAIAAGKEIFAANCVACHGADMHGGVGPDLTDATWIHGGKLEEIAHTITVGVPEKGMLTWGPILGPQKIAQVAAFVHSSGGGQ
jgi:cytochrome c oxidase cbb3-type subunit 3